MTIETNRVALITHLAEKSPDLGRTALMKYCYFLQVIRKVPLGYTFSLYSYGPFDSNVLSDLDSAEALGGVKTRVEYHPGGYGYRIEKGERTDAAQKWSKGFLKQHEEDIDWVLTQFKGLNSALLELASTIIYSDREAVAKSENLSIDTLTHRIQQIKPRFAEAQIRGTVIDLRGRGLLLAVTP